MARDLLMSLSRRLGVVTRRGAGGDGDEVPDGVTDQSEHSCLERLGISRGGDLMSCVPPSKNLAPELVAGPRGDGVRIFPE